MFQREKKNQQLPTTYMNLYPTPHMNQYQTDAVVSSNYSSKLIHTTLN